MGTELNRVFSKNEIQMTEKCLDMLNTFAIEEVQIQMSLVVNFL